MDDFATLVSFCSGVVHVEAADLQQTAADLSDQAQMM
jgi:hypothetical protein